MKHPYQSSTQRGRMVAIELKSAGWATKKVLFMNRAPLFI